MSVLKATALLLVLAFSGDAFASEGETEWWNDWSNPETALYLRQEEFDARNTEEVREFAECVVARDPEGSATFVGLPFGSTSQVEFSLEELMGGRMHECLEIGWGRPRELHMNPSLFLQMMVNRLVAAEREPAERLTDGRNPLERYGLCLLNNARQPVHEFLVAAAASRSDNPAYLELSHAARPCARELDGQDIRPASLRGLLMVVAFNAGALPENTGATE